ncbi:hypothetical protein [Prosthecobacter sp.]|uniref:hypothetical protein n=1 Tax=Prosthecobacter sp. TaxID=1965333 RepID=UPI002ABC0EA4|nr:hypothetical protein [Prosthecobacter sp.]MDZ4403639.1 hypothetical protein [Prosthecobacter sp.]
MINPGTIIFAIQAGIKLAGKARDIFIDRTHEHAVELPVGDIAGNELESAAVDYFRDHPELRAPGAPMAWVKTNADKVSAYRALRDIQADKPQDALTLIQQLGGVEQANAGFGARPALQRVVGLVAEIGIDYFALNPDKLGRNNGTRQVLESFIRNLDAVNFSESTPKILLSHVMHASLRTLHDNVTLLDDDRRLQTLVGGVTQSLLEDYEALGSAAERTRRGDLIQRIASSIVRGGATAFTGNIDLFMPADATAKTLVKHTLSGVIAGIDGKEDLFTNESLELIYKSALTAVAENSTVFTDQKLLTSLIRGTVTALSTPQASKVFGKETVSAIVQSALAAVTENVEILIHADKPEQQILADTVTAIANGLGKRLAGGATAHDLLSKRQLVELTQFAFTEVSKHPEQLLHRVDDDDVKTVLAQIIGSTAKALGENPKQLVTGEGFLTLVKSAVQTGVLNADKLLDLDTTNVRDNLLFQITQQAVEAVTAHPDPRRLVSRDVFVAIVTGILPVVSANLEDLLDDSLKKPVKATISAALELASGKLQNRVNGANLPVLIEGLLLQVLQDELTLTETAAVISTAKLILKHA